MNSEPPTFNTSTTKTNAIQPAIQPTITDLTHLLRSALTPPYLDDDPIHTCGPAPLAILASRSDDVIRLAHEKLHAFPYKDVPTCWRRLYTEGALWRALRVVEKELEAREREGGHGHGQRGEGADEEREEHYAEVDGGGGGGDLNGVERHDGGKQEDWITEVVRTLDMALILTGAPLREELIEEIMARLDSILSRTEERLSRHGTSSYKDIDDHEHTGTQSLPPAKRRKLSPTSCHLPSSFTSAPTYPPPLHHPIPRTRNPSLAAFQTHMTTKTAPLIITGALQHWPALCDPVRRWDDPAYLLRRTLGGRRLVPVEVGRSYTDEEWGQRILTMGQLLQEFIFYRGRGEDDSLDGGEKGGGREAKQQTGYLAQHDLFAQIPCLRADIGVPDYCYATPPSRPTSPSPSPSSPSPNQPPPHLDTPLLNAWFGPAGTISPLHTDPYHNVLAQVVGYKYVRLYAPGERGKLYARGVGEDGVDMGNTSWVDVGEAVRLFEGVEGEGARHGNSSDESGDGKGEEMRDGNGGGDAEHSASAIEQRRKDFEAAFPLFKEASHVEGVLGPGECLYIPAGWWHYVRSLSASFSVSFWWN